jgi:putative heme iron utilization protein
MSLGRDAREFLRTHRVGVLATHSKSVPGYPFGSVLPFVPDHAAHPVILVSALAEHTKSLLADPRASLIVHDFSVEEQQGPRLTVLGDCEPFEDERMARRFVRYLPESARFLDFGDFGFWRLRPREALFVRGFGRIDWVSATDLAAPSSRLMEAEDEIVAHMNADHVETMKLYVRHLHKRTPAGVQMVGLDAEGFHLRADGALLRCVFPAPVTNAGEARKAFVALAAQARSG